MFKTMLATALMLAVSVAAAENSSPATAGKEQTLPVILKSESIGPGVCRLHFENGASKDINMTCTNHADK